jgi:hypothetical protein
MVARICDSPAMIDGCEYAGEATADVGALDITVMDVQVSLVDTEAEATDTADTARDAVASEHVPLCSAQTTE